MSSWTVRIIVGAAGLVATLGLWATATAPNPDADSDVREVAATLRCPTCVAESAADSTAPLAAGMRASIDEQLRAGRTPEEIRGWFVERYGEQVLLEPPRHGIGMLLWILPLVLAPLVTWAVLRGRAGPRTSAVILAAASAAMLAGIAGTAWLVAGRQDGARPANTQVARPVDVLQEAAADSPGDVRVRAALAHALDATGRVADAAEQYRAAVRLAPLDDNLVYRAAFALSRIDRAEEAAALLEPLVARTPDHAEAVLLLGTLRHDTGDPRAGELLRRFIELAPDHPAAEQARIMLADGVAP